jgi:hypothetical protein
MNIKKLVAREGLIILSFLGISLLIILTPDLYIKPKPIGLAPGVTQAEIKSIDTLMELRKEYPQYNDLDNLNLAQKIASKYPEYEAVHKDFLEISERNKDKPNVFDISTAKPVQSTGETYRLDEIIKAGQQQEKVRTVGFYFLILGYPVYLLVRFIVWAIRTLREEK